MPLQKVKQNVKIYISDISCESFATPNDSPIWALSVFLDSYHRSAGHINLVKWSIANSCVSPSETCWILAAKNGHLDLLKYLAEFDVTTQKKSYQNYSSAILAAAASGGHMSIVQWGRK